MEEIEGDKMYRVCKVDYQNFTQDLTAQETRYKIFRFGIDI